MRRGSRVKRAAVVLASWVVVVAACGATVTAVARAQSKTGTGKIIATVGPVAITDDDFDARAQAARAAYRARSGEPLTEALTDYIDRSVLETLMRAHLAMLEAERRKVDVGDDEAEAFFKTNPFFTTDGRFDQRKYDLARTNDPKTFASGLENARRQIAGERLDQTIRRRFDPDPDTLKAAVERQLTLASLEHLTLDESDFSGEGPEPSEAEVARWFHEHREDYREPAHATITALAILHPHQHGGEHDDDQPEMVRPQADSALARIRAGEAFEAVAKIYGRTAEGIPVTAGRFPDYWEGDERSQKLVFETPAGEVLPELIPTHAGWLIVRVDSTTASRIPRLAEVADRVRTQVRQIQRRAADDQVLRKRYDPAKLARRPAYQVRYAYFDPEAFRVRKPSGRDIDRFYRAHIADYSAYDPETGSLSKRPLADVRDEIVGRIEREARLEQARRAAEDLADVWRSGRRDARRERAATWIREAGPIRPGAPPDSGAVGTVLGDTLSRYVAPVVGTMTSELGGIAYDLYRWIPNQPLTFEEVRDELATNLAAERARDFEQAVRARYESSPDSVVGGSIIHLTRLIFEPPDPLAVPLTREEVERYHREHLDRYSAPPLVHVRHILISPKDDSHEADRAAHQKAEQALARIRNGEDFADVAREMSDDPPTRDTGGDLGFFSRGQMLPEFERVAFALSPGQISDPFRTEVGWHIVECLEAEPIVAEPLSRIYSTVGFDAAVEKGERIAQMRADSVFKLVKTVDDARRIGAEAGARFDYLRHTVGTAIPDEEVATAMRALEHLPPGKLAPELYHIRRVGVFMQWVDSIVPAERVPWSKVRDRAMRDYRNALQHDALMAKCAEMDSLQRHGWSFDSLAVMWGGLEEIPVYRANTGISMRGGADALDRVVFGDDRRPAIAIGQPSDWIDLARGRTRVRVLERVPPEAGELARAVKKERRAVLEYRLRAFYDDLAKRFKVDIRDSRLKHVDFPAPPKPMTL